MSETPSNAPDQFATFKGFLRRLPPAERVSVDKIYSLVREGKLPVYRVAGEKAAVLRFNEARAILNRLSAQGKIRRGYGSFGPDAVVRDLSAVADDVEVLR